MLLICCCCSHSYSSRWRNASRKRKNHLEQSKDKILKSNTIWLFLFSFFLSAVVVVFIFAVVADVDVDVDVVIVAIDILYLMVGYHKKLGMLVTFHKVTACQRWRQWCTTNTNSTMVLHYPKVTVAWPQPKPPCLNRTKMLGYFLHICLVLGLRKRKWRGSEISPRQGYYFWCETEGIATVNSDERMLRNLSPSILRRNNEY